MGNNNATASLTEEESSKLETNGMSPLESVSVDITQEQVFLASEGKYGDQEKESLIDSITGEPETEPQSEELIEDPKVKKVEEVFLASEGKDGDQEKESLPDSITGEGEQETEPQSEELVEDPKVEEEMHPSGFDEHPQKITSVEEGIETVTEVEEMCLSLNETQNELIKLNTKEFGCEATEVEEFSMTETQSFVSKLETTESDNEEKPCVIDEIFSVSPSFYETVATKEKKSDESLDEIVPAEEVVKLEQETGLEQSTELPESKPQEILNLEYHIVVDDDEVTNEEKADQVISKPGSQESEAIQETNARIYEEEKDMESRREASLKRMSRCRSLPVSHNNRVTGGLLIKQFDSEVAFPSRNKMGLENTNTSETLLVSSLGSNKVEETTEVITERRKEAIVEMRSPSFGSDLRIEERRDEPTEKTPLLCQDKTETYEATVDVEEKIVMLKKSETEKTKGFELSLGLSLIPSGRSEADDSFKETKGSGDNFLDKKASLSSDSGDNLIVKKATMGSMKGKVRKRSKSSILGTCLCCANFASHQV